MVNRLEALGAEKAHELEQVDRYFAHPARNFAETDEALRVRVQRQGEQALAAVTYKGPKLDHTTKTRQEIEVPLQAAADAERFCRLLECLGFRFVLEVRKQRTVFQLVETERAVEVCLDRVDGLGSFVEIETAADEESQAEAVRVVLELGRKLGLTETERRAYLELLLEKLEKGVQ